MKDISVIIPVFNVEKYIAKAINSIKQQTFKNFECLIIDDGSQDNSINIAKSIISEDQRFKIITKKNGGLSDARNYGIKLSQGNYICFLDSDDYYSPLFLEKMYFSALKNESDIVICDVAYVSESEEIIRLHKNKYINTITGEIAFADVTISKSILCITQDKLFKKSIFEKIKYPQNVYYEDRATTYKLFLHSNKISFVNEVLFFYLQRKGSITNTLKEKNLSDRVLVMDLIKDYFVKNNLFEKYKEEYLICYLLNVYLSGASMIEKIDNRNHDWHNYLFRISDSKIFTINNILKVRKTNIKKMLALLALKIDYRLFSILYKKLN